MNSLERSLIKQLQQLQDSFENTEQLFNEFYQKYQQVYYENKVLQEELRQIAEMKLWERVKWALFTKR